MEDYTYRYVECVKDNPAFAKGKRFFITKRNDHNYVTSDKGITITYPLSSNFKIINLIGKRLIALVDEPRGIGFLKKGDTIEIENLSSGGTITLKNGYFCNVKDIYEKNLFLVEDELSINSDTIQLENGWKVGDQIILTDSMGYAGLITGEVGFIESIEKPYSFTINGYESAGIPYWKKVDSNPFKEGDIIVSINDARNTAMRKKGDIFVVQTIKDDYVYYSSNGYSPYKNFRHATAFEKKEYHSKKSTPITPKEAFPVEMSDCIPIFEEKENTNLIVTGKKLLPLIEVKKRLII